MKTKSKKAVTPTEKYMRTELTLDDLPWQLQGFYRHYRASSCGVPGDIAVFDVYAQFEGEYFCGFRLEWTGT